MSTVCLNETIPAPTPAARADAEELAGILMRIQRCFLLNLSKELARGNVSFPQFFLLGFLEQSQKLTMSGIAEKMGHTTAAATGLVDRLENMGYVERAHSFEDRRVVHVRITKKGSALVEKIREDMVTNLLKIMADLTEEEQKTWLRIYRRIIDMCCEGKPVES